MNRRGESRARPGPPRWSGRCLARPSLSRGRRVGSGRSRPCSPRLGERAAGAPRNLVPRARPSCAGTPLPSPAPRPGRHGPHVPVRCPFRRRSRPAPAPFRPLASPALAGGRCGPLPRARFLLPPTPAPRSCPAASPAFSLPAVRVAPAPRVLPPPACPGQPGTPRPHVSGPVTPTLHFCGPWQEEMAGNLVYS